MRARPIGLGRGGGEDGAGERALGCSRETHLSCGENGDEGRYVQRPGVSLPETSHMIHNTKRRIDNLCTQVHTCVHKLFGGGSSGSIPLPSGAPACH